MQKSTTKTLKYVGIGAVGLYVLSKMNLLKGITGGISEGITEGVIDTIVDGLSGIVGGVTGGIKDAVVTPLAENVSGGAYAVASGHGSWSDWAWSFSPIGGFGASAALANSLRYKYEPGAISTEGGYNTASGLTYISQKLQVRAASLQAIGGGNSAAGGYNNYLPSEVAYLQAVKEGKDVSIWNFYGNPHSTAFKALYPNVT